MSQSNNSSFEKQRDYLVQEIASAIDSVIYNLDILNRSLNESIQVGKEFDDVGRLWSSFYDGELRSRAEPGPEPAAGSTLEQIASEEKTASP